MTISLTDIEIQRVLDACIAYTEIMGQGQDTHEYTVYEMETGLGSALRKLSKGRNGERVYKSFKTMRQCPTFDEWKAAIVKNEAQDADELI